MLREQIALATIDLEDARHEEVDIEGLLGFAEYVLTNATRCGWRRRRSSGRDCSALFSPRGCVYATEGLEPR